MTRLILLTPVGDSNSVEFTVKGMHSVFGLFILLMVACCCTGLADNVYSNKKEHGYPDSNFIKKERSVNLILTGIDALRKLLAGTTRVPSQSKCYRQYLKDGDVKMAYRDFYSVNPKTVSKEKKWGVVKLRGIVGDREILLRDPTRSWKNSRKSSDIYVELTDIKKKLDLSDKPKVSLQAGQFVDRIIYKDLSD